MLWQLKNQVSGSIIQGDCNITLNSYAENPNRDRQGAEILTSDVKSFDITHPKKQW